MKRVDATCTKLWTDALILEPDPEVEAVFRELILARVKKWEGRKIWSEHNAMSSEVGTISSVQLEEYTDGWFLGKICYHWTYSPVWLWVEEPKSMPIKFAVTRDEKGLIDIFYHIDPTELVPLGAQNTIDYPTAGYLPKKYLENAKISSSCR